MKKGFFFKADPSKKKFQRIFLLFWLMRLKLAEYNERKFVSRIPATKMAGPPMAETLSPLILYKISGGANEHKIYE